MLRTTGVGASTPVGSISSRYTGSAMPAVGEAIVPSPNRTNTSEVIWKMSACTVVVGVCEGVGVLEGVMEGVGVQDGSGAAE